MLTPNGCVYTVGDVSDSVMRGHETPLPSPDVLGLVVESKRFKPAFFVGHLADVPLELKSSIRFLGERGAIESAVAVLVEAFGLDEGEAITVRFPTLHEERTRLAELVEQARRGGPNYEVSRNGSAIALREADGQIVGSPDPVSYEDEAPIRDDKDVA